MAITLADFNKIWASTSPLTPYSFSESNYKQGWNFIGSTPPARQMWDFLQKNNDEKMQFIVNDLLVPVDIDETANSGNYYSTSVPSGKVFANFNSIGGKTIAWNQLIQNGNFADSTGWTMQSGNGTLSVANNTATITVTGSGFSQYAPALKFPSVTYTNGHKYLTKMQIKCPVDSDMYYSVASVFGVLKYPTTTLNSWANWSSIDTCTASGTIQAYCGINTVSSLSVGMEIEFRNIQIFDLTLMFGSGNEPTTVAEFEAMFPASYYAYNEGTLLSAGVSNVISKDSSNNVVATMPIPSAVQSLEGYGWSAGSVYNYIDFQRKVFVKRVGKVVVDGSTIAMTSGGQFGSNYRFSVPNVPAPAAKVYDGTLKAVSAPIPYDYTETIENYQTTTQTSIAIWQNFTMLIVFVGNSITTVADANTWLQSHPVTIYYELATPIETDISAILGASGIASSSGGSLTFANSNGDNYRLPVPVSMDLLDGTNGLMTPQDKAKLDMIYDYIQRLGLS